MKPEVFIVGPSIFWGIILNFYTLMYEGIFIFVTCSSDFSSQIIASTNDKTRNLSSSFEAFTAVKFQVKVFWVVTPCSVVIGCQRFRGPYSLNLHPEDGGSMDL
jgi:hypothetical protein